MADLPDPQNLDETAARIDAAHAAAGPVAAIGDALAGAKPAAPKSDAANPDKKPDGTADGKKKKAVRGKGVARIVDELRRTGEYVTDDTPTTYRYAAARGAFEPLSEQRMLSIAYGQDLRSSPSKRAAIMKQLQAATYVERLTWGRVHEYEIPCVNGIYDVENGELRPHEPKNMLERSLPVAWNKDAACPTWLKALATWFPAAKEGGRVDALQEFFGYICMAHAKYKRALVLYGESNTGKSVPAMIAKALVGDEYCCSISVEHMDDPQRLALIKGKALNIMTEVSAEALIADGGFKTLVSTEEPVMLDGKWKQPETYISTAKHVIVTNNLPRLNDHTSATFNRLLIIPFDVVLPEADQDRDLLAKLIAELPGILVWALAGAARLVKRKGQWPDVAAARSIMTSYRDEMNPMRQFLRERMVRRRDAMEPLFLIAKRFNEWNMGARTVGIKGIGKLLRASGLESDLKVAKFQGRSITCLLGYRLAAAIGETLMATKTTGTVDDAGLEVLEVAPDTRSAEAAMDLDEEDDTS